MIYPIGVGCYRIHGHSPCTRGTCLRLDEEACERLHALRRKRRIVAGRTGEAIVERARISSGKRGCLGGRDWLLLRRDQYANHLHRFARLVSVDCKSQSSSVAFAIKGVKTTITHCSASELVKQSLVSNPRYVWLLPRTRTPTRFRRRSWQSHDEPSP